MAHMHATCSSEAPLSTSVLLLLGFQLSDSPSESRVSAMLRRLQDVHRPLPLGEWRRLREALTDFLQGARMRISHLLSSGIQSPNGTLVKVATGVLPRGATPPGTVSVLHSPEHSRPEPRAVPRTKCNSDYRSVAVQGAIVSPSRQFPVVRGTVTSRRSMEDIVDGFLVPTAPAWVHTLFQGTFDKGASPVAPGSNLYHEGSMRICARAVDGSGRTAAMGDASVCAQLKRLAQAKLTGDAYGACGVGVGVGAMKAPFCSEAKLSGCGDERDAEEKGMTAMSPAERAQAASDAKVEAKAHAVAELSVLASLVGTARPSPEAEDAYRPQLFTLNWGGDDDDNMHAPARAEAKVSSIC